MATEARWTGPQEDWDLDPLLEAMGGDLARLTSCLEVLYGQMPRDLEAILQALDAGHADRLASAAHAMRGAVTLVGAAELTRLTQRIEELAREEELSQARLMVETLVQETHRCLTAWGGEPVGEPAFSRSADRRDHPPAGE